MKVIALCESLGTTARLWRGLDGMADVDLSFLVSGGPFHQARAGTPADWRVAARLYLSGRLAFTRGFEHRSTFAHLRSLRPDVGLYACAGICRQPLLDCFARGVLHPHPARLPEYRGRDAMEWSILEGSPTGMTVFFLDPGIGTGREIVLRRAVRIGPEPDLASARRRLVERDAEFFHEALERLQDPGYRPIENHGRGRRFYAMSRLFTGVVEEALRSRVGA